jgi:hypothetical protein
MLRSVKSLTDYKIKAEDDTIGEVDSFLFHESSWIIRYLVVETGSWLSERKILISPESIEQPVTELKTLPLDLTKEQVRNSPDIDADKPISRQAEIELYKYYDWTPYWNAGSFTAPEKEPLSKRKKPAAAAVKEKVDSQLRSTKEVIDYYYIHAIDGDIGHVEDFVLEDENWIIRYMVVNTRNWLPGESVLISPQWIEKISWSDLKVWIDLLRDQIENSPRYDPSAPINQECETRLYDYYGRPKYWA